MFGTETNKIVQHGIDPRFQMKQGVDALANAVKVTLGPKGRNVIIQQELGPHVTKDGVTVAKSIQFSDPVKNLGAELVKQASAKTADLAGDGTSSSAILAQAMIDGGVKALMAGHDPIKMKNGMEQARDEILLNLAEETKQVETSNQIRQIGVISANGDELIGALIADAMEAVGKDGVIAVEEAQGLGAELTVLEGTQLEDRGFISPYFINNRSSQTWEAKDAMVLIYDEKIHRAQEIIPALELSLRHNKPLLIIADDIDGEALGALIMNKLQGGLNVCAVKSPGFGDRRAEMLRDLAILTGTTIIHNEAGETPDSVTLEHLGELSSVTVSRNNSVLVVDPDDERKALIEARAQSIRDQIEESLSEYDRMKLSERLSKLSGGAAVISIGAPTEVEMLEKKDRLDDALHATKAAVQEGIVKGGGVALLRAAQKATNEHLIGGMDVKAGYDIVKNACEAPIMSILQNGGYGAELIKTNILNGTEDGFDAREGVYTDMFSYGIIDPAKVTRLALENAVSVASMFITTEAVITNEQDV